MERTPISFNQTGPVGPAGPAGPPGGAATVDVHELSIAQPFSISSGLSDAALQLPAGRYVVTASGLTSFTDDSRGGWGICALNLTSGSIPPGIDPPVSSFASGHNDELLWTAPIGTDGVVPIHLQLAGALTAPGAARLECSGVSNAAGTVTLGAVRVIATQVNQVISESGAERSIGSVPGHLGTLTGLTAGESHTLERTGGSAVPPSKHP